MSRFLLLAASIGGGLLLLVSAVLLTLNWSERAFGPLVSFFIGGSVTTLATLLALLQPFSAERNLLTSVVLDTSEGAPPIVTKNPSALSLTTRLSEFTGLGRPVRVIDGVTKRTDTPPKTDEEMRSYCGEILQYYVLHAIRDIQGGGSSLLFAGGSVITTVHPKPKLTKVTKYLGNTLHTIIAKNRFADSQMEDSYWGGLSLILPENTRVSLVHSSTPESPAESYRLEMDKPLFFSMKIDLEPVLMSPGLGFVPKELNLSEEEVSRCRTFSFQVAMTVEFERITAGNWQTEELKKWADWLFTELEDRLKN